MEAGAQLRLGRRAAGEVIPRIREQIVEDTDMATILQ
jgi:hypothetical protein